MAKYWESEIPQVIKTNKNVLQYYPVAEKLGVMRPMWTDDNGKERPGKSVTMDISALLESDAETIRAARGVFADIVGYIDNRLGVLTED